jgi:nucleoside-diphosphate-sugar epimerase
MPPQPDPSSADAELDEALTRPSERDIAAAAALPGDIVILGAGGKMGPTLARLARRALDAAGSGHRVIAVSRFTTPREADRLAGHGIEVLAADLLDQAAIRTLPDAPHVVLMAGQKFGSTGDPARTWATNAVLPADVARRYASSRIVAFSTGNVYPLSPAPGPGPRESDPVDPVGEYAQSALARERILTFLSRRHETPMALLRLNYAVEPRYGVLRDIADRVRAGRPVPLAMGYVNVIWQGDACSVAWRALASCEVPPFVLNVTGADTLEVRAVAEAFGRHFGVTPSFTGSETGTALLSNAARCHDLFGAPSVPAREAIDRVAAWMLAGGGSLDRPTHFEERGGAF